MQRDEDGTTGEPRDGPEDVDPSVDAYLENFRILAQQLPVVTYRYGLDGLPPCTCPRRSKTCSATPRRIG